MIINKRLANQFIDKLKVILVNSNKYCYQKRKNFITKITTINISNKNQNKNSKICNKRFCSKIKIRAQKIFLIKKGNKDEKTYLNLTKVIAQIEVKLI